MNLAKSSTQASQDTLTSIAIDGITEPTIFRYFETLNAGDFEATSTLFAAEGVLQPPFEAAIVGPEAIVTYLQAEASGMQLQPREAVATPLDDGCTEFQVSGKVKTALFSVNVSWLFVLSPQQEILLAKIKLLASPKELLNLKR
jgi:hypothetical protein